MLRSKWVVETHVYDYFDYDGRYSHRQKSFSSLVEAFAYYKEEKAYDVEWDDHSQKTKIYHIFVYENEDKIRQEARREEKRIREEKRRQEEAQKAWEEQWQKREDEIRRILHPEHVEGEYLFDDGSNPFDDVAFNGLVDGADEIPLWAMIDERL